MYIFYTFELLFIRILRYSIRIHNDPCVVRCLFITLFDFKLPQVYRRYSCILTFSIPVVSRNFLLVFLLIIANDFDKSL
ncbi:hypothetical protein GCK32_013788 [Trichostrongylus colubriformis]|uniref:Uncharacterized protein n=1 Tax=Trichostrongylus colubriformis TaxID=6319 RepID=A0AAN8EXN3_TRICO